MNTPSKDAQGERYIEPSRRPEQTAGPRCELYGWFSALMASPHEHALPEADPKLGAHAAQLPYGFDLDETVQHISQRPLAELRAQYSALFEVGSKGPPVPIREDTARGQPAGVKEDLIRFYDYFSYRLSEQYAWAPDHLSVELEFMKLLTFGEVNRPEARLSYQLAQLDFGERHLLTWVPEAAHRAGVNDPDSIYGRVLEQLGNFLRSDFDWQHGTVSTHEESIDG